MPPVTYATPPSKRTVNRAGDYLAAVYAELVDVGSHVLDEMTDDESIDFVEAAQLLDWWRQEHAYPMLMVAAGLRYYVKPYAPADSLQKPVTQRLKKESTILDKLNRLPNMALCQMADIGEELATADRARTRLRR